MRDGLTRSRTAVVSVVAAGALWLAVPAAEQTASAAGCSAEMASIDGRFCVDRFEATVDIVSAKGAVLRRHSPYYPPPGGERLRARARQGVVPQAHISMVEAAQACEAAGKRLCSDAEWVTACKGRSPTLYPYGEEHQLGRCNDRGKSPLRVLHGRDDSVATFGFDAMNDPKLNQVPGSLARTGAFAGCRNSYGLYDMVGNLHEWTANPAGTFRGGYYLDTHINGQGCEYATTGHVPTYRDYSIGFRCCKSLGGAASATMPPPAARAKPEVRVAPGQQVVEVAPGDTLSGLAARYGVTVAALCEANDLGRDTPLALGRRLVVPARSAAPPGGARPASAGTRRGPELAPGERRHEVQPGQTLGGIAKRYGVTIDALCTRNAIPRNRPIRPGQQLVIPKAG